MSNAQANDDSRIEGAQANSAPRQFSVIVCTRNRAQFLEATLKSVLTQDYPSDRFELIVVDNDSTDGTRALVERYARVNQRTSLSYHLEKRPGTSFARNRGIDTARYDYVAFLDDDTVAAPRWLAAFDSAIREHGAVAAGGPVFASLEPGVERPPWWSDVEGLFAFDHAHLDPGSRVITLRWPLWLGGCNSVYSKQLLQDHGGFRTNFGPIGRRYRVAEDIDLNVRLERAGVTIYFVRDAWIKHRVTADRLSRRYVWRRTYCAGVTDAHAWAMLGRCSNSGSLRQIAKDLLQFVRCGETARTVAGLQVAYRAGYLHKSWAIALKEKLEARIRA
jgi:glycosyltransferase involved in cell wall biosynthesis